MDTSINAFVIYPAVPAEVEGTIDSAIQRLRESSFSRNIASWKDLDIPGRFIADGILERIDDSNLVIADISILNFNVAYEVGYTIGVGKRLLVIKRAALKNVDQQISTLGIFDTLGYKEYSTSDELVANVRAINDLAPVPIPADRNIKAPIYLNFAKYKSDQEALIQSRVKKARLYFRAFDPNETPRLSASEAIRNVAESYGILLHLIPLELDDAFNHNLRAAFLGGLAQGMRRELLLIQHDVTPVPADYRDIVTYCRERGQFITAIADFASRVTAAFQESVPITAKRVPKFLEQIKLGASSAENELTVLEAYYLEIDAFRRASRGEVRLITGRKGSGKTAIFFRLRDTIRSRRANVVLDLKPDGYQLLKFKDRVLKLMASGTLDHTITAFWEYLLLLEICYKLLEKDKEVHKRDHNLFEPYQRLRAAYLTDEYVGEGDFSERMNSLLHHISEDFDAKYGKTEDLSLSQPQITGLLYRHDVSTLRKHVQDYLRFKEELWLLFDNIDKGWPTHGIRLQDLVIIKALIEATRKVERELARSNIVAHTVVFLRNDVYELLVQETPDRGKEARANVDWSEADLLREMLRRRIVFGNPDLQNASFSDIWRQVCVSHINGEESSQYLIERSLMRPRYLIELLNHCRGYAANLRHDVIQEEDVKNGLKAYSTDLLSDISLEVRDIMPEGENAVYGFIGAPLRFNHEMLEKMIRESGAVDENLKAIYRVLLWFGFLGAIETDGEAKYIHSYSYDMKLFQAAIAKMQAGGISYQVNPAFWSALGIKDPYT